MAIAKNSHAQTDLLDPRVQMEIEDNDFREVVVQFQGVESPKRMSNAEDIANEVTRHVFDVPACLIPVDELLVLDGPNPRQPNTRKKAAKLVKESLTGVRGEARGKFHHAHGGIRMLASEVKKLNDSTLEVTFRVDGASTTSDDGVANGLHTIALIGEAIAEEADLNGQYVTVTVIENLDRSIVPYVAEGLNTSLQVTAESIINLRGAFKPFEDAISGQHYRDRFAWSENDPGDYDVRDILAILNALNVARYPNAQTDRHPVESYEKQSAVVKAFDDDEGSFVSMAPLLVDALFLYDLIGCDSYERYRDEVPEGRSGGLAIMDRKKALDGSAKSDVWEFPFISEDPEDPKRATYRLSKGARFAMLAAFRNFVVMNPDTGQAEWAGGFEAVKQAWQKLGGELTVSAKETSQALGYNPQSVGKNRPLWKQFHDRVARYRAKVEMKRLKAEVEALRAAAL